MKLVDESFEKRINDQFAAMRADISNLTHAVNDLCKAVELLAGAEDDDEPVHDLDGGELPPDRPEGQPL